MDGTLKEKIGKGLREIPMELQPFIRRNYPAFVTGRKVQPLFKEVPVFMFHTLNRFVFQEQLDFLKSNGYQTLTLKTFMAFLRGDVQLKAPSILLTFDDGDKSWYRVAYPLLRQYGFHAVGFVVPHYLEEQPDRTSAKGWLSWPEVIEMDRSGVVDVQSHSYYHDRIFIQPKVVDFFHPEFDPNHLGLDIPWIEEAGCYTNQLKWGAPIYRYASRLEGHARYFDDEEVRQACLSWVDSQGGRAFFGRPNWRRELQTFYKTVSQNHRKNPYESTQERRNKVFEDLVRAKKILEERLGKPVQHLCYPWGAGGALSVSLSQEAGYISNFWCTVNGRNSNREGDSPFCIPRLKDDYLFRLPGQGRKSLLKIFQGKLSHRIKTLDLY